MGQESRASRSRRARSTAARAFSSSLRAWSQWRRARRSSASAAPRAVFASRSLVRAAASSGFLCSGGAGLAGVDFAGGAADRRAAVVSVAAFPAYRRPPPLASVRPEAHTRARYRSRAAPAHGRAAPRAPAARRHRRPRPRGATGAPPRRRGGSGGRALLVRPSSPPPGRPCPRTERRVARRLRAGTARPRRGAPGRAGSPRPRPRSAYAAPSPALRLRAAPRCAARAPPGRAPG